MQQETIESILSGDLDAYDAVVRQYQGILLGCAANRLPDIDAAQEVVQLTFIRAYEQLNEYQSERDFGVWLCVICKHFIMTELERRRRESRNLENFSHALRLRVCEQLVTGPDEGQRDLLSAMRECVQALQSQAASVVRLRYEERQSCQSIAASLDRTVTWVTSTLSRSRKSLRQLFPEREDVLLNQQYVVSGTEAGTYSRLGRKHTVKLTEDVRVDSFLLQYNPIRDDNVSGEQVFRGQLHFDRPIVALILQKDLLDDSDAQLALPATDFRNIFRRGINSTDTVTLSPDRRVLRVAFDVENGVDQIRVLLAADNIKPNWKQGR